MMRGTKPLLVVSGLLLAVSMWAQSSKTDKEKEKPKKPFPGFAVFLGHSNVSEKDIHISKRSFDSLMKQGLTARDSSGNPFQFHGFTFTYGERNLYEDSIGNLVVMTDLLTEFCPGDTLSRNISSVLFQRTKRGDTAYIDDITLVDEKGLSHKGRSMRIILE